MMNRKDRIYQLIQQEFHPTFLEVLDESKQHHVPENAETHYKVTIVSEKFEQQSRVARHRQINTLLHEELISGLHALSMHLYTPEEWDDQKRSPNSPACRDGYKNR